MKRAIVVGLAVLAACSGDSDNASTVTTASRSTTTTTPGPTTAPPYWDEMCPGRLRHVAYESKSATTSANFTAAMPDGTSQGDFTPPLKNETGSEGLQFCSTPDEFLYLSIQNGTDSGGVTCVIRVDGEIVAQNTSRGAYVIASCDG